ncbi:MAG: hypothetical protein KJO17_11995, partial [Acidimicrobiia bacterium]|nr:hypothetical protein [Acidimicrobiia bacterium]
MRRSLIALLLLVAACTGSGDGVVTVGESTLPPTTSPPPPPRGSVEVRLSEAEALASTGDTVRVGPVSLSGTSPQRFEVTAGQPVILPIYYVEDGIAVEPSWTQTVTVGEDAVVELVIEQSWRAPEPPPPPLVMAWQTGGDAETYLEQLAAAPGLTVTSPRWWTLDREGFLVGETDPEFVAAAQDLGVAVWPYMTNGFERRRTGLLLNDPAKRRLVAAQLSRAAQEAGVGGINIDFEAFNAADREAFTAFMDELTSLAHEWGGIVSVDVTARTTSRPAIATDRSHRYDRRALAEVVDYVVLMAYDEHTRFNPSGPTASPAWAQDALYWLFRFVDADQVVLGVPFYSRVWDPVELNAPVTATIGTVVELSTAGRSTFDPEFALHRVDLEDGRHFWVEDYANLAGRLTLARESGVAGVAAWRLGFDTPRVWEVVE